MARTPSQRKAEAAWDRIESLGGHGVWEPDTVIVSLENTKVTDDDLSLLRDFPFVNVLDLSHTSIANDGLSHLNGLPGLEELIVIDTRISGSALAAFRRKYPYVTATTEPPPRDALNPFTGKPL